MSTNKAVYKHVFLEYSEYQRLLETSSKYEDLLEKFKTLQKKIHELEKDQEGKGLHKLVEKEYTEKLQTPLLGLAESITLPPSAQIQQIHENEVTSKTARRKRKTSSPWYYLGRPKNESQ